MTATLEVRNLRVRFPTRRGMFAAVDGVSFDVEPGETLGVVGESGSGKSLSMLAILGLLPPGPPWEVTGQAFLNGRDLLRLSAQELRRVRGGEVAMIFQNPTSSLNPVFTVGDQVGEAIRVTTRARPQPKSANALCGSWSWSTSPIPRGGCNSSRTSSQAEWPSAS